MLSQNSLEQEPGSGNVFADLGLPDADEHRIIRQRADSGCRSAVHRH